VFCAALDSLEESCVRVLGVDMVIFWDFYRNRLLKRCGHLKQMEWTPGFPRKLISIK
jgi:hypothetical protein